MPDSKITHSSPGHRLFEHQLLTGMPPGFLIGQEADPMLPQYCRFKGKFFQFPNGRREYKKSDSSGIRWDIGMHYIQQTHSPKALHETLNTTQKAAFHKQSIEQFNL